MKNHLLCFCSCSIQVESIPLYLYTHCERVKVKEVFKQNIGHSLFVSCGTYLTESKGTIGAPCLAGNLCYDANTFCSQGTCQCRNNFFDNRGYCGTCTEHSFGISKVELNTTGPFGFYTN